MEAFELGKLLFSQAKKPQKKDFAIGDRVKYYGTFNDQPEVTFATVKGFHKNGLIYLRLDQHVDDDGPNQGPCWAWSHPKQLRRVKKKT